MQKNIQEKDTHEKKENRILIKLHRKNTHTHTKGSRKNKSSSTSGQATQALPLPPLELNGHRIFTTFFLHTIFGLK